MDGRGVADGNSTSTDTFVMGTFVINPMLAGAPQASACKAQFRATNNGNLVGDIHRRLLAQGRSRRVGRGRVAWLVVGW